VVDDSGRHEPADVDLVAALQRRDESMFTTVVRRYHGPLLRLALAYHPSRAVAEEIVQEAWLAVVQGIDRFERRSSFKTWLFRILVNRARTRAEREGRMVPFSSLVSEAEAEDGPAVPVDRFVPADHPDWAQWAGHWMLAPKSWGESPEQALIARETQALIDAAIAALSPGQRQVITLRDVEGWSSDEVCNVLEISETNQRVLLHRARSRVRAVLERYFDVDSR
jgi:RNA polymerase sigma-70 factor (ECF subfamily)